MSQNRSCPRRPWTYFPAPLVFIAILAGGGRWFQPSGSAAAQTDAGTPPSPSATKSDVPQTSEAARDPLKEIAQVIYQVTAAMLEKKPGPANDPAGTDPWGASDLLAKGGRLHSLAEAIRKVNGQAEKIANAKGDVCLPAAREFSKTLKDFEAPLKKKTHEVTYSEKENTSAYRALTPVFHALGRMQMIHQVASGVDNAIKDQAAAGRGVPMPNGTAIKATVRATKDGLDKALKAPVFSQAGAGQPLTESLTQLHEVAEAMLDDWKLGATRTALTEFEHCLANAREAAAALEPQNPEVARFTLRFLKIAQDNLAAALATGKP